MMKIKVGILISYDYAFAHKCIERVYNSADRIVLAVDKDYRTWAGGKFEIDPLFFDTIKANDPQGKIDIYRGDFYESSLSTMSNETRERNMLAEYMGRDSGWHIQVDSDEYFIDFDAFVEYLHSLEPRIKGRKFDIWADWISLFKYDKNGFYAALPRRGGGGGPIATCWPYYGCAREIAAHDHFRLNCSYGVLHQNWARTDEEVMQKIKNWSHNTDFDTAAYFEFWRSINKYNAPYVKDFHPLKGIEQTWHELKYYPGDIDSMLVQFKVETDPIKVAKINAMNYRQAQIKNGFIYQILLKLYQKVRRTISR